MIGLGGTVNLGLMSFILLTISILGFIFMPFSANASDPMDDSPVQSAEVSLKVIGPIKNDIPLVAFPLLANDTDYAFEISFLNPGTNETLKEVNYNVRIRTGPDDNIQIFDAAQQNSDNNSMLHAADGTATVHHTFHQFGGAFVTVIYFGTDSEPVSPESSEFIYSIVDSHSVPEFPSMAASSISFLMGIPVLFYVRMKFWK